MERCSSDSDKLPPCIVMMLHVAPDASTTPCDLTLPVTLVGVRKPKNKLDIIRPLEGTCYIVYFILHVICLLYLKLWSTATDQSFYSEFVGPPGCCIVVFVGLHKRALLQCSKCSIAL